MASSRGRGRHPSVIKLATMHIVMGLVGGYEQPVSHEFFMIRQSLYYGIINRQNAPPSRHIFGGDACDVVALMQNWTVSWIRCVQGGIACRGQAVLHCKIVQKYVVTYITYCWQYKLCTEGRQRPVGSTWIFRQFSQLHNKERSRASSRASAPLLLYEKVKGHPGRLRSY